MQKKRIGDFLLERGIITEKQLHEILVYSQRTGLRMGDAALEMGLVTPEKLGELFGPNNQADFFHIEPGFFPQATRDLLPLDMIIGVGALPLGFKTEYRMFKARRLLNIGLLNPSRQDALPALEKLARNASGPGATHGIKIFLILADQYLDVLRQVYGVDESALRSRPPGELDETLKYFLKR